MTVKILSDPESAEVCVLLYLYSIEPPFYADISNACRDLDLSKLPSLGPFVQALNGVLVNGQVSDEKRDDALRQGWKYDADGPLGFYSESFLLFKGCVMKDEWL